MKRLDQWLVELGLAPTRSKAQQLITAGDVEARVHGQWRVLAQPSYKTEKLSLDDLRIKPASPVLRYVSRGGLKLEHALQLTGLNPQGWRCLDAGQSTGGFTDCLLQHGAREVLGFDVGHGQLHPRLVADPRVRTLEGVNVRDLPAQPALTAWLSEGCQLCVADLAFISLEHAIPPLAAVLPKGCEVLLLLKPQFEVGPEHLDKGGIVKDQTLFDDVKGRILRTLEKYGFSILTHFPCAVKGQDGNQEFILHARRD